MSSVDQARLMMMGMATQMLAVQMYRMGVAPAGTYPNGFNPKDSAQQQLVKDMYDEWKVWYDGFQKALDLRDPASGLGDPKSLSPDSAGTNVGANLPNLVNNIISNLPTLVTQPAQLTVLQQLMSAIQSAIPTVSTITNAPVVLNPAKS